MARGNWILVVMFLLVLYFMFFRLIIFIFLCWLIYRLIKYFIDKRNNFYLESIEDMSPYEFEHYIGKLFRKMGYRSTITPASGDFGIDVIAKNSSETIAIQVKKYKDHPVGNMEVQRLLGAMQMKNVRADRSIIITTSRFTKNAIRQAEECPIELWDGKKLAKVIRQNLKKKPRKTFLTKIKETLK